MWTAGLLVASMCFWTSTDGTYSCRRAAGGDYYREEVLLEDDALQESTAADWINNKIYMLKRSTTSGYEVLAWDIDSSSFSILGELPEYCWLTVDQRFSRVYAGCRNRTGHGGLYIYDRHPQQFVPLTELATDIRYVHFADRLYYINFGEFKLRSFSHGQSQSVSDLQGAEIWHFTVDGRDDWIYSFEGNVYHGQVDARSELVTPGRNIWSMAVGPHGDVYGAGGRVGGIYRIDADNNIAKKVVDTYGECYLTVDKGDNFICYISDVQRSIVRYVRCNT